MTSAVLLADAPQTVRLPRMIELIKTYDTILHGFIVSPFCRFRLKFAFPRNPGRSQYLILALSEIWPCISHPMNAKYIWGSPANRFSKPQGKVQPGLPYVCGCKTTINQPHKWQNVTFPLSSKGPIQYLRTCPSLVISIKHYTKRPFPLIIRI